MNTETKTYTITEEQRTLIGDIVSKYCALYQYRLSCIDGLIAQAHFNCNEEEENRLESIRERYTNDYVPTYQAYNLLTEILKSASDNTK